MLKSRRLLIFAALLAAFLLRHAQRGSAQGGTHPSYGLEWPGDGAVRRMLYWHNPFPIYDATYILKIYPRKKTFGTYRYYTTFFWGNDGDFIWDRSNANTYYGAHPYPIPAPDGPGQWEVSVSGNDFVTGREVEWNRWHIQAFRAWRESPSITHHEFYWDLPDTSKVISKTIVDPAWANRNPPTPAIVIGQAPNLNGASWGGYPGWEEFNGIIRGIQIYSGLLSLADIQSEIAVPKSTPAGRNFIWYLNVDPRPGDVTDKKGTGIAHNPSWDGTTALEWTDQTSPPGPDPQPTATYLIPENGGQSWRMTETSESTDVSFARVESDVSNPAVSGVAIFAYRAGGALVTEAGVPASSPIRSGRVYVEADGPVSTGLAFANSNSRDAVVDYYFTDINGVDFGQGAFTLGGNRQLSAFTSEPPFNGPSAMRGTLTFSSSVPIAVVAIRGFTNQRHEFLITSLPVADLADRSGSTILVPHFADGGGWSAQLILTNPSDLPVSGTVQFFGPGSVGQDTPALNISLNGVANTMFTYTIQPRAAVRLTTGNESSVTRVGSVRITPSAGIAPTVSSIFSLERNGIRVTEAGSSPAATGMAFRIYVESTGASGEVGSVQSGVAIANPSATPLAVTLELTRLDGTPSGAPALVTIPAGGQIARFIKEFFPSLQSFVGFLSVTSASPMGVTGLRGRYNERGDFLITTTPPWNRDVASPAGELVFPHIVAGGGYTTQFVLFGQAGSGKLWVLSRDGTPLPVSKLEAVH